MRAALALIILATLVLTTTTAPLSAATLTVDPDGDGDYTEIQPAIDAAVNGDTVLVKPGEYLIVEPIDFNRLYLPDNPGGPAFKNITLRSEAGTEATTIRMTEEPADPERASVVIFESGETEASVLEGFTLTGGKGTRWGDDWDQYGGGLICVAGSSPNIVSCIVIQNTVADFGAGVSCFEASPTLTDCRIVGHSGNHVGAVYFHGGSPTLASCTVSGNSTEKYCPGVYMLNGSSPALRGCTITGNSADSGSAVYCCNGLPCTGTCSPTLEDCTIADNAGGGVRVPNASITDCTISRNAGVGLKCWGTSTVANCTISENSVGVRAGSSCTLTDCTISENYSQGLYCNGNTGESPTLTGCTISLNGVARSSSTTSGAGVYCDYESSPTLIDCIISENYDDGLHLKRASSPTLAGCTISRNAGTGVYCLDGASPTLTSCTISGNDAYWGGGLYCGDESSPTLINCVISENSAARGGGVLIYGSSARLAHCTLYGNSATEKGGGVYLRSSFGTTTTLTHCIIWGNVGGALTLENSGTGLEVKFCCVQTPEVWQGESNINTNPLFCGFAGPRDVFVDATAPEGGDGTAESPFRDLAAALADEYRLSLQEGSPCIGAGTGGENLGADLGTCTTGEPGDRVVQLAAGHYSMKGLSLLHLAGILGEGPGETVLQGTVEGLATSATLSHVTVTGGRNGGILVSAYTSPSIEFCTVRGNSGDFGVCCGESSSPTLRNCTIAGNSRGGVSCSADSFPEMTSCIVWDNAGHSISAADSASPHVTFSCVQGDEVWPDEGNINQDPLFCAWNEAEVRIDDPEDFVAALRGFSVALSDGSPCLESGEGDSDMGSEPRSCTAPGKPTRVVSLAGDTYAIHELHLTHGVSLRGAGPNETVLEGTVHGLRTGAFLSGVTVTRGIEGGIVVAEGEAPEIYNCTLAGNGSFPWALGPWIEGGGVFCDKAASPILTNCTISTNVAGSGGAVHCEKGASPVLINCTLAGNAAQTGSAVNCESGSSPTLTNCIVLGEVTRCTDLSHCLTDQDPLFVHNGVFDFTRFTEPVEIDGELVEFPDFIVEPPDFRLQPGSPAIDAGTCEGAPEFDFIGTPRPIGAGCDIGAYEYPEVPTGTRFLRGEANADGTIDLSDAISTLGYLFLGNAKPPCLKAADSDDNGSVELTDAVYLLSQLFLDGPEPPAPYPACGLDLTSDNLTCEQFVGCAD